MTIHWRMGNCDELSLRYTAFDEYVTRPGGHEVCCLFFFIFSLFFLEAYKHPTSPTSPTLLFFSFLVFEGGGRTGGRGWFWFLGTVRF